MVQKLVIANWQEGVILQNCMDSIAGFDLFSASRSPMFSMDKADG